MVERNPALWTGEAIFGAVSLMLRPFAPRARAFYESCATPVRGGTVFGVNEALNHFGNPRLWAERAQRECFVGQQLFGAGLDASLALEPGSEASIERVRAAAQQARAALHSCSEWLAARPAVNDRYGAGSELFNVLLRRGHLSESSADELLREASNAITREKSKLAMLASATAGSWEHVQQALADDHPSAGDYYGAFGRTWDACHELALHARSRHLA